MDELEISGKRYISSRRAAQEYKYHADYIGQLVRAKKVAGQKVAVTGKVSGDRVIGPVLGSGDTIEVASIDAGM